MAGVGRHENCGGDFTLEIGIINITTHKNEVKHSEEQDKILTILRAQRSLNHDTQNLVNDICSCHSSMLRSCIIRRGDLY